MFKNKANETETKSTMSKSAPAPNNSTYTRIGEEVMFEGNINCQGDLRIDGSVNGNINTKSRVLLGPKGKILGNIQCTSAELDGKVKGQIDCKNLLSITQNADIEGDIVTGKLSINEPKNFNVSSCQMRKDSEPSIPKPAVKKA